jgi:NADH/NAD ratio-sensing transcriptional regulator Rex
MSAHPGADATGAQNTATGADNAGAGRRAMSAVSPDNEAPRHVPEATVARLATYLRVLTGMVDEQVTTCSSEDLAAATGVNSAMLRKDLSYLGSYGIRGVGYDVQTLTGQIARVLGLTVHRRVALIGVGHLGTALAGYTGFASRGFTIAALIDIDPARIGTRIGGLTVSDIADLDAIVTAARGAGPIRAAVVRSAGPRRRDEHPQLRPRRLVGPVPCGRTQGRPGRRTADPVLPREPQGRARPDRGRAMTSAMTSAMSSAAATDRVIR